MGRLLLRVFYRVRWQGKGRPRPPPQVSHAIQEVCHRFLVLGVGLEAVSEASRHLAIELLGLGQVAALGEDLCFVDVGVVASHGRFVSVDGISLQGQVAESGAEWTLPRPSHHIDAVLLVVGRVVLTPVGKASDEGIIVGAVLQLHQPSGDAAMLCLKHQQERGDDASAVNHGSFAVESILQGVGGHPCPLLCH